MDKTVFPKGPIGIFDSGFGGLTVFKEIVNLLPQYDYIYLGDNARVPYGTRSFDTVYEYTKQCVSKLFEMGCNLIILACNTASAKALRTLQHNDLPEGKKILGVIRPTAEVIDQYTSNQVVGILATPGTVNSQSYLLEIQRFHPTIQVHQQACPFWVPLVENNDLDSAGAHFFVKRDLEELLARQPEMDAIFLACTHYPLLLPLIQQYAPPKVRIVSQGTLVAESLQHYLERHPEIKNRCKTGGLLTFYTTDQADEFDKKAEIFFGQDVKSKFIRV
ncbi:MAG TPA: glutamate racemase [Candidatus Sphingobacterium stercorigallinarum]|nr:glutamate racemase [Candidatus Sphingobacterium stercorigallinarum]